VIQRNLLKENFIILFADSMSRTCYLILYWNRLISAVFIRLLRSWLQYISAKWSIAIFAWTWVLWSSTKSDLERNVCEVPCFSSIKVGNHFLAIISITNRIMRRANIEISIALLEVVLHEYINKNYSLWNIDMQVQNYYWKYCQTWLVLRNALNFSCKLIFYPWRR
jgi:hypothetical protein